MAGLLTSCAILASVIVTITTVRQEAGQELPALTKAELAEPLFHQIGLNKREAKDMVDAFFNEIRSALERGEAVRLSGFGNFLLRDKPPRPGRNPKTGEEIPIAARRVVTFHASPKLRCAVEETNPLASADQTEITALMQEQWTP